MDPEFLSWLRRLQWASAIIPVAGVVLLGLDALIERVFFRKESGDE